MNELGNLSWAVREIRELRRRNQVLGAQVFVVETFAAALNREGPLGFTEDHLFELEQRVADLQSADKETGDMPSQGNQGGTVARS